EVLIRHEPQHAPSPWQVPAGKKSVPHPDRAEPGFVLVADLCSLPAAPLQVRIDLLLVPEVIAKGRVYIGQPQRGVLGGDRFGTSPLTEGPDQGIDRHPRPADTNDAVRVRCEGDGVSDEDQGHLLTSSSLTG